VSRFLKQKVKVDRQAVESGRACQSSDSQKGEVRVPRAAQSSQGPQHEPGMKQLVAAPHPNGCFPPWSGSRNAMPASACFRIYPSFACSRHALLLSFAKQASRTPSPERAARAEPEALLLRDRKPASITRLRWHFRDYNQAAIGYRNNHPAETYSTPATVSLSIPTFRPRWHNAVPSGIRNQLTHMLTCMDNDPAAAHANFLSVLLPETADRVSGK
jgi:hypothetical protein